jgi:hypothetical protein
MDLPCCICKRTFKTQKQLSAHASKCEENLAFTLDSICQKQEKKWKLQARDKHRDKKAHLATPIDEQELDYVELNQDILFNDVSWFLTSMRLYL